MALPELAAGVGFEVGVVEPPPPYPVLPVPPVAPPPQAASRSAAAPPTSAGLIHPETRILRTSSSC
ncbi:MAG: hypothetical protein ACREOV_05195 [Candidatus Dormibacteraceae bacterium]